MQCNIAMGLMINYENGRQYSYAVVVTNKSLS